MEYGDIGKVELKSLQQTLGTAILRKSMNQDAQSVSALLSGMKSSNSLEQAVTPHKGKSIDVRV